MKNKTAIFIIFIFTLALFLCHGSAFAADGIESLKTFGASSKEVFLFKDVKEAELFEHTGKGCLNHMWFGGSWPDYGKITIRVYVDGESAPSIEMELFMGHGIGFQDQAAPWGVRRIGKTGEPSGVYNTYRIPFGKSVKVTAQLAETSPKDQPFWYIIRGVENEPVVFNGVKLPDSARLHLHKLENYTAQPLEEFSICDAEKSGMLYQVTIAAKSSQFTFLESMVRAYIDGAETPVFLSSGLEDYFLGTYYFNRGRYYNEIAGLTHLDKDRFEFSAYRFHEEDPVFFSKGFKLTLRCGEQTELLTWKAPETTYTTYAWVYEW